MTLIEIDVCSNRMKKPCKHANCPIYSPNKKKTITDSNEKMNYQCFAVFFFVVRPTSWQWALISNLMTIHKTWLRGQSIKIHSKLLLWYLCIWSCVKTQHAHIMYNLLIRIQYNFDFCSILILRKKVKVEDI